MKIIEGEVKLIGNGTWVAKGDGGQTSLSVLEIGNSTLKRVIITDYMSNYLRIGAQTKLLVATGLSQGMITRPFIAALEVDGKKYKEGSGKVILMFVLKVILYSIVIGGPLSYANSFLGTIAILAIAGYYVKDYLDLTKF